MDVVCERCQTEYEFDDALVSERGTTVKCTNCGQQFKIYRPTADPNRSAVWVLRRTDGSTVQFDSLAVLQKWIADARVTRADQLSRGGAEWKPLGSIAELESFFVTAETRVGSRAPPAPDPRASAPAQRGAPRTLSGHPPTASNAPAVVPRVAPPAAPRNPPIARNPNESFADTIAPDATPAYSIGTGAPPATPSVRGSYALGDSGAIVERWQSPGAPRAEPTPARPPQRPMVDPRAVSDEDVTASDADDVELPMRGGTGRFVLVGLVVLFLGAAVGVVVWKLGLLSRSTVATAALPATPDRVATGVIRAEQTARSADEASFEEARDTLTAMLGTEPDEPRVRAARAAILALSAEQQRQRAEDLDARAAAAGADAASLHAEAQVIRRDASAALDRARQDASTAEAGVSRVAAGGDRLRFDRALGDASRVLGDNASAARHLAAARTDGGGADVDLLSALVERDANQLDAAIVHLRPLADRPETSVRAHLALARLLAARGDPTALAEVQAVLREHASNEGARFLSEAITGHLPPFVSSASAVQAVAGTDAGATHAAVPGAPDASAAQVALAATADGGSGGSESNAGASYETLVERGDRYQERGSRDRARQAYMAALDARSDGVEAISGMGYVELDGGSASTAIMHFRRALGINPRFGDAIIGLAEAYGRAGQTQESLRQYQEYLSNSPNGPHAAEARRHVEALQQRTGGESNGATGGSGGTATPPTSGTTSPSESGSGTSGGGSGGGAGGGAGSGGSSGGSGSGGAPPSGGTPPSGGSEGSGTGSGGSGATGGGSGATGTAPAN